MERLVLDRFEENRAVIEKTHYNGEVSYFSVPKATVSSEAKEGDIIRAEGDIFAPDYDATKAAKEKAVSLLEKMKRKSQ